MSRVLCFSLLINISYLMGVDIRYDNKSSLTELLLLYDLYKETPKGKSILNKTISILSRIGCDDIEKIDSSLFIRSGVQHPLKLSVLDDSQLILIEHLSKNLKHKQLKGHDCWSKKEIELLPAEEIDLSKALLLFRLEDARLIKSYEAYLDCLALEVLSRLPNNPNKREILEGIKKLLFYDLRFKFPPGYKSIEEIDFYTSLPSVIESKHGVCLGTTILFISIAQRVGLPMEIITPPGHIYISIELDGEIINIETTSRGINIPTDRYLGINETAPHKRNIKEVIGLSFHNKGYNAWQNGNIKKAIDNYQQSLKFLDNDPLANALLGYLLAISGDIKEAKRLLRKSKKMENSMYIKGDTITNDFLERKIDVDGLQILLQSTSNDRKSLIGKIEDLERLLKKHPHCKSAMLQLGMTFLKINDYKKALDTLENFHKIDATHPVVEYYLAYTSAKCYNFKKGHYHLNLLEKILMEKNHSPKSLSALKDFIKKEFPSSNNL